MAPHQETGNLTATAAFLPRHLNSELNVELATARGVNLVGPRQVGKTTLVRDSYGHGRFITLDDPSVLSAIDADPMGHLNGLRTEAGTAPLVADEAQKSKVLALATKRPVDLDRRKRQFLLTGSSNIFTTTEVANSLEGRMRTRKLWPLTTAEAARASVNRLMDWAVHRCPALKQLSDPEPVNRYDCIHLVPAGGFPEVGTLPLRSRQRQ